MPTFPPVRHKIVTGYGDVFLRTKEAADVGDINNWIKENQASINAAFADKAGGATVKVLAVYIISGDGKERKV
jgi:hypothetical protein